MSAFRRMMTMLGLVEDDYDEEAFDEASSGRARALATVEPEAQPGVRPLGRDGGAEQPGGVSWTRPSVVRPIVPLQSSKPHTVTPAMFEDCREIGDRLKAGVPVIVNLQTVDRDLMRRIIDFMSGLSYGTGSPLEKTADRVYLLTPTNAVSRS